MLIKMKSGPQSQGLVCQMRHCRHTYGMHICGQDSWWKVLITQWKANHIWFEVSPYCNNLVSGFWRIVESSLSTYKTSQTKESENKLPDCIHQVRSGINILSKKRNHLLLILISKRKYQASGNSGDNALVLTNLYSEIKLWSMKHQRVSWVELHHSTKV